MLLHAQRMWGWVWSLKMLNYFKFGNCDLKKFWLKEKNSKHEAGGLGSPFIPLCHLPHKGRPWSFLNIPYWIWRDHRRQPAWRGGFCSASSGLLLESTYHIASTAFVSLVFIPKTLRAAWVPVDRGHRGTMLLWFPLKGSISANFQFVPVWNAASYDIILSSDVKTLRKVSIKCFISLSLVGGAGFIFKGKPRLADPFSSFAAFEILPWNILHEVLHILVTHFCISKGWRLHRRTGVKSQRRSYQRRCNAKFNQFRCLNLNQHATMPTVAYISTMLIIKEKGFGRNFQDRYQKIRESSH